MTYLSVKRVAELLALTERAVRYSAAANHYLTRYIPGRGRGGRQLQIALESLPESAQAKYRGETPASKPPDALARLTAAQRAVALSRGNIVTKYLEFKEIYPKSDKLSAFLELYNREHPNVPLTRRQLTSWVSIYKKEGITALCDRRGGHNKGASSIPEDIWQAFMAMWSKQGKPSASLCYQMLSAMFPGRELPSYSCFIRRLETVDKGYKVLAREGKKAYEDKCLPYNIIDTTGMHSNECWIADHHIFDVLCLFEDGTVGRPWGCFWQDWKSRYIVSYSLSQHAPNSDLILDSFARGCSRNGVPEMVKLDNGKDFKVYDLFNNEFEFSLSNSLGIKVSRALPYNAKAKPIERTFRTLEGYCKLLDAYTGNNPMARPEHMKGTNAKLKDKAMPIGDFMRYINGCVKDYNNKQHTGQGMEGRTPSDVYISSVTVPVRKVDPLLLCMYFSRTTKPLSVGRNGVRLPQTGFYYDNEALYPYIGQQVFARFNTDNMSQIYLFTAQDEYICTAFNQELCTLDMDNSMAAIRNNQRLKSKRKQLDKLQTSIRATSTIEEAIHSKAVDTPAVALLEGNNSINLVNSTKRNHARAIEAEQRKREAKQNKDTLQAVSGEYSPVQDNLYMLMRDTFGDFGQRED